MRVSVSDAKAQLSALMHRAQAGDEVVLTRRGQPAVRLVPVKTAPDRATRRGILEALSRAGAAKAVAGASAARSQDFLYADDFARTDLTA